MTLTRRHRSCMPTHRIPINNHLPCGKDDQSYKESLDCYHKKPGQCFMGRLHDGLWVVAKLYVTPRRVTHFSFQKSSSVRNTPPMCVYFLSNASRRVEIHPHDEISAHSHCLFSSCNVQTLMHISAKIANTQKAMTFWYH